MVDGPPDGRRGLANTSYVAGTLGRCLAALLSIVIVSACGGTGSSAPAERRPQTTSIAIGVSQPLDVIDGAVGGNRLEIMSAI